MAPSGFRVDHRVAEPAQTPRNEQQTAKQPDNASGRPCKACEGAGVFRSETDLDWSGVRSVLGGECDFRDCRACGGSGRVVDRIPASDAIADAETLRANSNYALPVDVPGEPRAAEVWARIAFWTVPGLRGDGCSGGAK